MTRYANAKRDSDIVSLFILGIPPKQIPGRLRKRYPDITVHIVYHVTEMFQSEQSCENVRKPSIDSNTSTA